jgi:hypothetical protein
VYIVFVLGRNRGRIGATFSELDDRHLTIAARFVINTSSSEEGIGL